MDHIVTPAYAWLTVNRQCNFRCEWCYAKGTEFSNDQQMTLDTAITITNLLVDAGVGHVFVTGGEPTLWAPLLKYNAHCNDIGLKTTVFTNAMRFGEDAFWDAYKKNPNSYVGVSLKAGSKSQLYGTAKVRQFDLVTKGIRRSMEYFQSGVGIVYNSYVADNLVEICRYAVEDCHANSVKLDFCSPIFVDGKAVSQCVVEPHQLAAGVLRDYPIIAETLRDFSFIMSMPFCLWPKSFIETLVAEDKIESVCHVIKREGIVVASDGSLCMCNELFDFPIGRFNEDFADSDSLVKFLNREDINSYYAEISRYPSKKCDLCSLKSECGGGCPLLWSIYDPDQYVQPFEGGE